jgi:branched-subunit amino acid transport protein
MNYALMILGMAAITIAIRAAIFVLGDRIAFPPIVKQALDFVPVTVLTAIIVPMAVAPHGGGLELTWRNPQLVGAIAAVALCAATRHQLLTIVGAMLVFFGWQFGVLN